MIKIGVYRLNGFNFLNAKKFSLISTASFNKSTSIKEASLLRKLNSNESFYNEICSKGFNQVVNTITIDSNIDLYSNLTLLKTGIKLWKLQHPFLNSTVSSEENGKYFIKVKNVEFLNNIEFLSYKPFYELNDEVNAVYNLYNKVKNVFDKSNKQIDTREICNVIHNIFINTPVPPKNEYLWKLLFIKLDLTRYCVVFVSHTEITNQSISYSLMKQLFNIIDATYSNKPLTSEFHLIHQIPKPLDNFQSKNDFDLKVYNPDESILETKIKKVFINGVISDNNDIFYPSHDKLLNLKGEKLRFNKKLTEFFFQNCKLYNAEPASSFAILMSIALQQAFKKFAKAQTEIVYTLTVNLNKLSISHETMGNYDAQIIEKIDVEAVNRDFEKSRFWKLASEETLKNDNNFSQMKLFDYSNLEQVDLDKFFNSYETNNSKSFNFHFSISNFGSIQNFPDSIGNFKITDLQSGRTASKYGVRSNLFSIYLLNIDEELNVNFDVYTALKQEFAKCVIDTFEENFKKLLE